MTLLQEIQRHENDLMAAVNQLKEVFKDYVLAENEYNKIKAQRTLELKANGNPISLIENIIKGDEPVLVERIKLGTFEANKEYLEQKIMTLQCILKSKNARLQGELRVGNII